jgi:hypothetical protein
MSHPDWVDFPSNATLKFSEDGCRPYCHTSTARPLTSQQYCSSDTVGTWVEEQDTTRKDKTSQDKVRQDKNRRDQTRPDQTRQVWFCQDKTRQDYSRLDQIRPDSTRPDLTCPNQTGQEKIRLDESRPDQTWLGFERKTGVPKSREIRIVSDVLRCVAGRPPWVEDVAHRAMAATERSILLLKWSRRAFFRPMPTKQVIPIYICVCPFLL